MQVTGEMELEGGGRIIMRGFGRFNISLWDAVLAELEPITEADTILVNFGSWYNRLYIDDGAAQWEGWKADMQELVEQRLARTRAAVVWKGYTTFHYAGETGALTGVRQAWQPDIVGVAHCIMDCSEVLGALDDAPDYASKSPSSALAAGTAAIPSFVDSASARTARSVERFMQGLLLEGAMGALLETLHEPLHDGCSSRAMLGYRRPRKAAGCIYKVA